MSPPPRYVVAGNKSTSLRAYRTRGTSVPQSTSCQSSSLPQSIGFSVPMASSCCPLLHFLHSLVATQQALTPPIISQSLSASVAACKSKFRLLNLSSRVLKMVPAPHTPCFLEHLLLFTSWPFPKSILFSHEQPVLLLGVPSSLPSWRACP